jgi:murein L,D-transpeptidase YafK
MQGDKALQQYDNIAIGQRGVAELHLQGDETTPLGDYRIISVSHTSRFKLFFGLDYPTRDHAKLAFMRKQIVSQDFQRIVDAHSTGSVPPSSTPLGGEIGIHGIGFGNASVHEQYNWTRGCVALSNDQIQDLARWVDIGTRVVIK